MASDKRVPGLDIAPMSELDHIQGVRLASWVNTMAVLALWDLKECQRDARESQRTNDSMLSIIEIIDFCRSYSSELGKHRVDLATSSEGGVQEQGLVA
ncbi:hypothetical protein NDU88_003631 [Pleurodeles waltl]|uniref:Uncharacterized protein n=1 Tax=Pleurodeles waltl TaxID=8319 RepID=A0AAV7KW52_PLEWA|nr:hypothetical protein NDU88_003631 [Pleurodeles waltl]